MKARTLLATIATLLLLSFVSTATAQFKISIPKIPKIKKETPAESRESTTTNSSPPSSEGTAPQAYNETAFRAFAQKREPLFGFVPCYAKKHKLRLPDLVIYTDYYPYPAFDRYSPLQEQVAEKRKALADLELELKRKFATRPNTGKGPDANPAIWEEITTNRDEYITCALTDFEEKSEDARVSTFQDEVKEALQEVKDYTPQTKTAIVQGKHWEWLERAISPAARTEFLNKWSSLLQPKQRQGFERDLDAIKADLPPKLSAFTQDKINNFPFRNPAEERMMRSQLNELTGLVVHKIGLYQNQWLIEKNDWGLPVNRYKQGAIYGRDPRSDHPYCRIWYVNMIQNYSGGGTYAASYAKYVGSDFVVCPAK
ncbi:MAG TPA: hypothetical protein PLK77_11860 [Pyrinomonadaceae bacterium]|nr:hypothetical protein [Pyrinomonadaceae bacterium]